MIDKEWTKIGEIGVDAGLCWIGDPCYIIDKDENDTPFKSWGDFCNRLQDGNVTQFNHPMGHPGLGVVVSTGYGDGYYDVFAKFCDDIMFGGKNKRIAEVKVVFIIEDDMYQDEVDSE